MNVSLQTSAEAFLARYEGLRERLPGDAAIREAAAASLRRLGLPTQRDEAWHYTSLRPLGDASFHEALTEIAPRGPACDVLAEDVAPIDAPRLVFTDGRLREDLSVLPESVVFRSFADAPDFGSLARADDDPLVALNTMLAEDGAIIEVPEGVDAGLLLLVSLGADVGGMPVAFHPRHAIRLARGARLTLLEIARGEGPYLHNPVTEIQVAEGATLTHVRLQDEAPEAFQLATLYAEVAAEGVYDGFTLNLGARLCRAEVHARLAGPGGAAHLNGAQMLRDHQLADITTVVRHDAPGCASRQTVKTVLAGRSRGVFQGRIEVARAAQKTDGYQMNQALLLSPEAEMDSKPELEIFADDVKCSHGATVGELDAEQLFYLRSRGVPEAEARAILVRAFLAEAFEPVRHEAVRALLERAVSGWWSEAA